MRSCPGALPPWGLSAFWALLCFRNGRGFGTLAPWCICARLRAGRCRGFRREAPIRGAADLSTMREASRRRWRRGWGTTPCRRGRHAHAEGDPSPRRAPASEAELVLPGADGRPAGERRLHGAQTCADFADSVALASSLALDPSCSSARPNGSPSFHRPCSLRRGPPRWLSRLPPRGSSLNGRPRLHR